MVMENFLLHKLHIAHRYETPSYENHRLVVRDQKHLQNFENTRPIISPLTPPLSNISMVTRCRSINSKTLDC